MTRLYAGMMPSRRTIRLFVAAFALLAVVAPVAAGSNLNDRITRCEDAGLTLNAIAAMRFFAQGSVKLFTIEREEPAAAPSGIAITIDRGSELPDLESFCQYIGGFSHADVAGAKARYDNKRALLTVTVPIRQYNPEKDRFNDGMLVLVIDKAAKNPSELVNAQLR